MAYCTPDDVASNAAFREKLKAIIGIDNSNTAETDSDAQLSSILMSYITMASNEIDMKLGSLYQIPIPVTAVQSTQMLKSICVLLALGYVYLMHADGKIPEGMSAQIEQARSNLDDYGKGGNYKGRIFVPVHLPDAPTNTAFGIHAPQRIEPSARDIVDAVPLYR